MLERRYVYPDDWNYFMMRANLYAEAAKTVVAAIAAIAAADDAGVPLARPQEELGARYWPRIPESDLAIARATLPRTSAV